jgi:hypothetical protein
MCTFAVDKLGLRITRIVRTTREGDEMTITPAQIKTARSILGWTQVELSCRSKVPNSVIALFENP